MHSGHPLLRLTGIGLLICSVTAVKAQLNRGVIEGIVTDPQGGVVPGVEVTITSLERNVSLPTQTNSAGYYRAVDLIPGRYRTHFVASGFSALDVNDIEVPAGEVIRVDGQLKLGEALQVVEVKGGLALVETAPTNYSTTLETRTIDEVPLAGRDLQQLVFLVPGVASVSGPPGSNFGFNSMYGSFPDPTHILGSDVAVGGGQGGANAWYLDGNINLSGVSENVAVNPSPDSVQEFQTITNSLSAEYGRTGGGVFNVVLKSGTNRVHGNIYEYLRNDATNARNPFAPTDVKQRQLRFNNFGGTLGGPVLLPHLYNGKDKTFFFFSWDTSILHLLGNQTYTVPTAFMRQGNFSEDPNTALYGIWDPLTTVGPNAQGLFDRTALGTPVAGNPYGANGCLASAVSAGAAKGVQTCAFSSQLPANRLDPVAMYFMNSFPLANFNNPLNQFCPKDQSGVSICSNYRGAVGSSLDNHNISLKVDHQWSNKSRDFAEWLYNPGKYNNYRLPWTGPTAQFAGWSGASGYGGDHPVDLMNQIIALGNTYSLRPTLINEFRLSYSRQFFSTDPSHPFPDSITQQSKTQQVLAPLRIPTNISSPVPDWYMSAPGGSIHFGPNGYDNMITGGDAYTVLDNITKVAGKHTIKTGVIYRLDHYFWEGDYPTSLSFYGGLTSNPRTGLGGGSGLAQFLLGAVGPNTGYSGFAAGHEDSPYSRWSYWGTYVQDDYHVTPHLTLNLGLRYDLFDWFKTRFTAGDVNFCLSCIDPGSGLRGEVIRTKGRSIWPSNKNDLGPRINFAWSPFGSSKTVIRGGYDIFYSNAQVTAGTWGGAVSEGGHGLFPSFPLSWTPGTCPNYSGQCEVFPLSDTTTDKRSLAVPPLTGAVPGNNPTNPLYLQFITAYFANRDPMVQQWGFEVQRELPGNASLSVGYVGTHGTHLEGTIYKGLNYVHDSDILKYKYHLYDPTPISAIYSGSAASQLQKSYGTTTLPLGNLLVGYPLYSLYGSAVYDGTTVYNALNVRIQKRYSNGLNFITAYTYSQKIDNGDVGGGTSDLEISPFGLGGAGRVAALSYTAGRQRFLYRDQDNKKIDRFIAPDDMKHMLNLAATYELPLGAGRHFLNRRGVLNQAVGGWLLTANLNAESGVPLTISCPGDSFVNLSAGFGANWYVARCNLIGNPRFRGGRSKAARIADWINPAAFEPSFGSDLTFWANYNPLDPRAFTTGNADTFLSGIRSPGFWNVDTSLGKQFHLSESKYFEFRWQMFNALNHQNLGYPNTGFCLPPKPDGTTDLVHQAGCSFGRIFDVQTDPRSMQFALKFVW